MIEEKRVEDSRVETVHIIRPNHLNAAGRLFGGMLMQWLDEVAGMVAKRHTRANVITASVDNLRFIHGAYKGEMVVIVGKVTYVGTTSMEVRVDTYVEHMEDGMRRPINRAYFTMVALDEDDKPKQVPRLILETEAQRAHPPRRSGRAAQWRCCRWTSAAADPRRGAPAWGHTRWRRRATAVRPCRGAARAHRRPPPRARRPCECPAARAAAPSCARQKADC